eukprot:TRINITY_DN8509_c0_g1_i1.p1 TRINITY_DN8509_c0_g1~~TRINITY_DN8509_c0_g1_i1.p1  ORF type:complete len:326 (+),score=44.70 TRINITY_DN8509_c0_g1_i1:277-1254(+)
MSGLVNKEYDLIDPNPDIRSLFMQFDALYFSNRLGSVEVKWSNRMTTCAGLCYYQAGGYCSIKLSEKLLQFRSRKETLETLLHEMIHAYLFVTRNNRDRDGHGPEFQKHMNRINQDGYNISIYHNFFQEVDYFKTHHWQCQGRCKRIVKRAMNRAPGPHDRWWKKHERECGGGYIKIKEPEGYQKKKPSKRKRDIETNHKITDFFKVESEKGNLLSKEIVVDKSIPASERSRIATINRLKKKRKIEVPKQLSIVDYVNITQVDKPLEIIDLTCETIEPVEINPVAVHVRIEPVESVKIVHVCCPSCSEHIDEREINQHLDSCLMI